MPRPVQLFVLDTGRIECDDFTIFSPSASPNQRQEMSVRSYVVVHPDGVLLWDTGIADEIADEPGGRQIADAIRFHVPRTLRSQLAALGVAHADVDVLAFSHLHIDHVGNLDLFPQATVVMQRAEYDAAHGPDAEALTYLPDTYAALDHDRVQTISGEYDVFGDGTAVTIPLPGHTPGHQGLLVMLPQTGPVLLAGDIAYAAPDYAAEQARATNVDPAASVEAIRKAKALERDLGATVWLHHDTEDQQAVPLAPEHHG